MHTQKGVSEAPFVKSQNCLGAYPQTPLAQSILWAPQFYGESGIPELLYPQTKFSSESCIPVHDTLVDLVWLQVHAEHRREDQ